MSSLFSSSPSSPSPPVDLNTDNWKALATLSLLGMVNGLQAEQFFAYHFNQQESASYRFLSQDMEALNAAFHLATRLVYEVMEADQKVSFNVATQSLSAQSSYSRNKTLGELKESISKCKESMAGGAVLSRLQGFWAEELSIVKDQNMGMVGFQPFILQLLPPSSDPDVENGKDIARLAKAWNALIHGRNSDTYEPHLGWKDTVFARKDSGIDAFVALTYLAIHSALEILVEAHYMGAWEPVKSVVTDAGLEKLRVTCERSLKGNDDAFLLTKGKSDGQYVAFNNTVRHTTAHWMNHYPEDCPTAGGSKTKGLTSKLKKFGRK